MSGAGDGSDPTAPSCEVSQTHLDAGWDGRSPLLNFTQAEFEQAGLFHWLPSQPGGPSCGASRFDVDQYLSNNAGESAPVGLCGFRPSGLPYQPSATQAPPNRTDHSPIGPSSAQATAHTLQQQQAAPVQHKPEAINKKNMNRQYQKQFRLRQKAKAQAVTAQLAETTLELDRLKLQQRKLGKLLGQAQSISLPSQDQTPDAWPDDEVDKGPPLTISVAGKARQCSIQDVTHLPMKAFKPLWMDYVRDLELCLAALHSRPDPAVEHRLQQLVFEVLRLKGHNLRFRPDSPSKARDPQQAQQAQGVAQAAVKRCFIPAHLLDVLCLSTEQVKDLMFLRRLFILKRRELDKQRAALTAQMQDARTLANATLVHELAQALCLNATADHQSFVRFVSATYFGVFTMQQAAKMVIHCDPEVTLVADPLDHIAHRCGFPTKQQILSNAPEGLNKAEWQHFWSYAETISPYLSLQSEYIPIGAIKPPAMSQLLLY